MLTSAGFTVKYPVEEFINWMEERAVEAGIIHQFQTISVLDVNYDNGNGYVIVDGDIWTQQHG
jgi:hypothetical protein